MDSNVSSIVKKVGDEFGVPFEILYSIVMNESGGNPNAHAVTSKEDSRGLFQVNIKAHPDANSGMLFNPEYNTRYMMPTLSKVYQDGKSKGLSGVDLALYVERYGERPAWTTNVENRIRKYYAEATGGSVTTSSNDTNTSRGTTTTKTLLGIPSGSEIQQSVNTVMDGVKFYFSYGIIFVLFMFSLYMIFINRGSEK